MPPFLFPLINWLATTPPAPHTLPAPSLPSFWALTDLPDVIKNVSDSFPVLAGNWLFWVCTATVLALVIFTAGWFWFSDRGTTSKLNGDNPQRLFEELLTHLRLAKDDRAVLRQMTRGARLRHPTMSLLSPGLLHWSCKLWQQEKGARTVTQKKSPTSTPSPANSTTTSPAQTHSPQPPLPAPMQSQLPKTKKTPRPPNPPPSA